MFLICFVIFMGYLTYRAFNVDFDLVADDYYAQELAYEERLDEMRNVAALEEQPIVSIANGIVAINLPKSQALGSHGEVYFYDPTSRKGDRTFALELDTEGRMELPVSVLDAHRYQLKLSWKNGDKTFFHETTLEL